MEKTSLTEFRNLMRSGNVPAYFSLNCISKGIVLHASWSVFQTKPEIQFLKNAMDGQTDGQTDGWTNRQTDGRTDGRTDRRMDGGPDKCFYKDVRIKK